MDKSLPPQSSITLDKELPVFTVYHSLCFLQLLSPKLKQRFLKKAKVSQLIDNSVHKRLILKVMFLFPFYFPVILVQYR